MTSADPVLYEQDGHVVTITLNRPDMRNPLAEDVIAALISALLRAEGDKAVHCVVLTGAGKSFCAGGNLNEIRKLSAEKTPLEIADWYRDGIQRIPLTFETLSVPVVAAVNGHAIGAGCDLACMADIRICGEGARFAESFLRVGIIPGDGGAWLLPRIVGHARAMHMLLTAEGVTAKRALDWGLVTEIASDADLLSRAQALAAAIAAQPPAATREAKRLMLKARAQSLADSLAEAAVMQGVLQQAADHQEAVAAILEKRKPSFEGR
ncbi:enoyl-CoA hydratase-related protein [Pacificimonas flava]|uniref:Enoyl-CoA hydratase n=1 Tax=Pacificimonas flava TaxID=1234595 RepID=M2T8C5_9SPHN|nr:enoyl-CoA hydratase-related protein [Pacificimonas flava]EMD82769.1 Enoyl-CoA hydratase [Pacificimonas flava]MBB5279387.1 enoyl-CoA hydratase/carnithine racemase [Pacificimonas flava]